jgi:hypothetical protein
MHDLGKRVEEIGARVGEIGAFALSVLLAIIVLDVFGIIDVRWFQEPGKGARSDTLKIVQVETFREGVMVFFRLFFSDPNSDAAGFGFRGANGARWVEENHPFSSPSYGRFSQGSIGGHTLLGKIEYPFNLRCTNAGSGDQSDVEAWIYDKARRRSPSIVVHLECHVKNCAESGKCATSIAACPLNFTNESRPITCSCPAGAGSGPVWGSLTYSDDSSICQAALHAGAVSADGGEVRVHPAPGCPSYSASTRNGVKSLSYGNWRSSFFFPAVGGGKC